MAEELVLVRNSEKALFKQCRQAWKWSYVDRLKPIREKPALSYGTLAHRVLELRYPPGRKRGPACKRLAVKVWKEHLASGGEEFFVKIGGEQITAGDLLVEMFTNYQEEYGDDERYKVISAEQVFQIDVYHPKSGRYLFTYVGTIDGIWYDLWEKRYLFAEHKTGATLDPFGAPIYLDDQQGGYWAFGYQWAIAVGLIPENAVMEGVLYNRLRKAFADRRPRDENGMCLNQNGSVSKNQPTPLFKREMIYRTERERARTMWRTINEVSEMQKVRNGKLKVYKTSGRHCRWCDFRDACEVHEGCGDYRSILDSQYREWDPYDAHEIIQILEEEDHG